MNYIKSITYGFICALLLVACSEDDAPKIFTGDISATLISKGATEIVEGEQATITYDVILSRSFDKEISLKFSLANASVSDKLFTIKNPVKIAKNQTKGVLTITAPKKKDSENVLKEDQSFKINLDEITGIPNKVDFK